MSRNYLYGTEAPELTTSERSYKEQPVKKSSSYVSEPHSESRNALFFSLFAAVMLLCLSASLFCYLSLVSDVTRSERRISSAQSSLDSLRRKNDERLNEIENALDLNDIRTIAIRDYGMIYPDSEDVIHYSTAADKGDYVKQVMSAD